jgi:hypothetical protein
MIRIIYRLAVFTTSGIFTVPKGVKSIDVFCVGGGGSSGGPYRSYAYGVSSGDGCGGGGGGYTKTVLKSPVNEDQKISVTVGAKSSTTPSFTYGPFYITYIGSQAFYTRDVTSTSYSSGNISSVGDICSANGGSTANYVYGGSGGSGGGNGYHAYGYVGTGTSKGGSDGGDGGTTGYYDTSNPYISSTITMYGGKGQGTTTRYFGESNGTLYSTGGDGVYYSNSGAEGGNNTGNGGFGYYVRAGGSGIAIIRWGHKK